MKVELKKKEQQTVSLKEEFEKKLKRDIELRLGNQAEQFEMVIITSQLKLNEAEKINA